MLSCPKSEVCFRFSPPKDGEQCLRCGHVEQCHADKRCGGQPFDKLARPRDLTKADLERFSSDLESRARNYGEAEPAILMVPSNLTPEQLSEFQAYWDSCLNRGLRSKVIPIDQ